MAETLSGGDNEIKEGRRTDHYIWGSYIALLIISIIELFSASSQEVSVDNIYGPIMRHGMFLAAGLLLMLLVQRMHFKRIYFLIPAYVLMSLAMMALVLAVGVNINGARRGLQVAGIMLLPAEFLKLAVALGIAWILSRSQIKGRRDVTTGGVVACTLLVLVSSAMLFSHGLTNTLLLMGISIAMMLVGGVSWRKLGYVGLVYVVIGSGAMIYKAVAHKDAGPTPEDYALAEINHSEEVVSSSKGNRFGTWEERIRRHLRLNKSADPITDENKQEQLSYIAQAHGGLTGVGIGRSRETARLPLAFSDYIYAIVVEELGAVVAIFVLALYLFLLGRAGRLAMVFKSTLPCLLVIGCALVICIQALFHICIVVGVFPVSGQPLPLISKGGTSIIATSLALGVMLSASRWAARTTDGEDTYRRELSTLPESAATVNPSQI
ncbi:MAG: FtsW/RodA/SpoVE family cell cycle protein [Bacteroidales bacterium]|nr:FtsW/RodA/SpoVE family cell cycle protein [Bacteroidales bacterium]